MREADVKRRLRAAFSVFVGLLIAAVVASIWVRQATHLAAVCALAALGVALPLVRRSQQIVGLVMIAVGILAMGVAVALGYHIEPIGLLKLNQDIIGMLGGVAFLGFISRYARQVQPRLRGAAAVWRTSLVTHLLGSVINLSAVTIIGDHVRDDEGLLPGDALVITRSYAAAGFWSPLWAGSALAMSFAGGAKLGVSVLGGTLMAAAVMAGSMPSTLKAFGPDLATYRGYALSWRLLRIPLVLMAGVLTLHFALPDVPVPRLVALGALAVTVVATVLREPRRAWHNLSTEARNTLPGVCGEVSLFVSAGIMALGLDALIDVVDLTLPFDRYTVVMAWLTIVVMTLLVLVGVHQVITVGFIAPLVLPLHPDPTVFMASVMIGWGTSAAIGPLTGLQMYMQGRYGVSGMDTTRRNLVYLANSLVFSFPVLLLVQWLA